MNKIVFTCAIRSCAEAFALSLKKANPLFVPVLEEDRRRREIAVRRIQASGKIPVLYKKPEFFINQEDFELLKDEQAYYVMYYMPMDSILEYYITREAQICAFDMIRELSEIKFLYEDLQDHPFHLIAEDASEVADHFPDPDYYAPEDLLESVLSIEQYDIEQFIEMLTQLTSFYSTVQWFRDSYMVIRGDLSDQPGLDYMQDLVKASSEIDEHVSLYIEEGKDALDLKKLHDDVADALIAVLAICSEFNFDPTFLMFFRMREVTDGLFLLNGM